MFLFLKLWQSRIDLENIKDDDVSLKSQEFSLFGGAVVSYAVKVSLSEDI